MLQKIFGKLLMPKKAVKNLKAKIEAISYFGRWDSPVLKGVAEGNAGLLEAAKQSCLSLIANLEKGTKAPESFVSALEALESQAEATERGFKESIKPILRLPEIDPVAKELIGLNNLLFKNYKELLILTRKAIRILI